MATRLKKTVTFVQLVSLTCFIINDNGCHGYRRGGRERTEQRRCEKTTIPLCTQIGYNLTYMPNRFGHKTQFDAGLIIHQFMLLVLINCSSRLKHFLCSLYAPVCDPLYQKEIVPCRSFCEEVRNSCAPVMKGNGFPWPSDLQCSNFPTRAENRICMKPDSDNKTKGKLDSFLKETQGRQKADSRTGKDCRCRCNHPFVHRVVARGGGGGGAGLPVCALQCGKYFFSERQIKFVTFWLGLWSGIALTATLFTITTYFLNRQSFSYTERPIIFIAFCYMMVSFGYVIRLVYGHANIACDSHTGLTRYASNGPAQCTAVFILTYFFTGVAWLWWVFLALHWYLAHGLRWTADAIARFSQYFHFLPWLIPTAQTMALLAMTAIDGDPVSGLCSPGNHDSNIHNIFVIAPLLVYSTLSLIFSAAGIVAMCGTRRNHENRQNSLVDDMNKQRRYFSRIGLFTFILFVPALSLLGISLYEHFYRAQWERARNCPCVRERPAPNYYMYFIKYFMSLMGGLTTGVWALETRTLMTWKQFIRRLVVTSSTSREATALQNEFPSADRYGFPDLL